jgi:hypothetical protein
MRVRSIAAMAILALLLGGGTAVANPAPVDAQRPVPRSAAQRRGPPPAVERRRRLRGVRRRYKSRVRECLRGSPIRIRAFVNRPDGLGGTNTYVIHPRWLAEDAALVLFGSSREVAPGYGAGRFYAVRCRRRSAGWSGSTGAAGSTSRRMWTTRRHAGATPPASRRRGQPGARPSRCAATSWCCPPSGGPPGRSRHLDGAADHGHGAAGDAMARVGDPAAGCAARRLRVAAASPVELPPRTLSRVAAPAGHDEAPVGDRGVG